MARPRSDDRRRSLLEAATEVFAEHGLSAPTSLISKTAGVSEGSLFTYFKTKDELINALYREIRLDLAAAVMSGFPRKAGIRDRLEHVWTRYVSWGVENPAERKALKHVSMSKAITAGIGSEGGTLFEEVDRIQMDAVAQRKLQLPPVMASQALKAFAEMTMDLIERHPAKAKQFTSSGFQMLWGALRSKPLS
jgi:AcrR family transcriptional regulator